MPLKAVSSSYLNAVAGNDGKSKSKKTPYLNVRDWSSLRQAFKTGGLGKFQATNHFTTPVTTLRAGHRVSVGKLTPLRARLW